MNVAAEFTLPKFGKASFAATVFSKASFAATVFGKASFAATIIIFSAWASNSLLAGGEALFNSKKYEEAANWYLKFINDRPDDKKTVPQALIGLGRSLEGMSDIINTRAERACFRSPGKVKGTPCMKNFAEKLDAVYGDGSFEYLEQMVVIRYTGAHYKKVVDEFPGSQSAPEAAYLYLAKNLVGHPDQVLPRIKEYMKKYKDSQWGRKGRLLWARVNEDVWWIHRKWSWVLYNWTISQEELIVKAEPYRQEALRSFSELIKEAGNTEEGRIAKREYELLKEYKDDGHLYGIVNESDIEGTRAMPGHK